jgi:transposase
MRKRKDAASRQELLGIIRRLEARNAALEERVEEQAKRINELERELAKARKNSSTSSKPPSSDIVKPPKPRPAGSEGKRKIGGQPGHPKHVRPPFPPEAVNETHVHTLDACPDCGGRLQPGTHEPRVIQQVEIIETPITITEHHGRAYWCPGCQRVHVAPLPAGVEKGGLVGARLTALIGFLKGACHMSFSTIRKFLRDVLGTPISRGQLSKVVNKVSEAVRETYDDLLGRLALEAYLNVDETGHKENKRRLWTWCFRAEAYTVFHIAETRSSQVLWDVLGEEFNGVLGCDYFSTYRKYMKDCSILVQFCLAHLIRDVKYLTTLPDPATVAYGQDVLEALRGLFHVFHRRDEMSESAFAAALADAREAVMAAALVDAPPAREVQNMADRFRQHGDAYFQFITTPGIDPTNNLAEQAMRFVVIDRYITQGTRSPKGRTWCERIWTVLATCAQQGRSAFDFLCQAVEAHFNGRPAPTLVGFP